MRSRSNICTSLGRSVVDCRQQPAVRPGPRRGSQARPEGMMARVVFTSNLRRDVACPPVEAPGASVRAVLEAVFVDNPRLRGYILDDQGRLREHVAVFVDGRLIRDRTTLADPVPSEAE